MFYFVAGEKGQQGGPVDSTSSVQGEVDSALSLTTSVVLHNTDSFDEGPTASFASTDSWHRGQGHTSAADFVTSTTSITSLHTDASYDVRLQDYTGQASDANRLPAISLGGNSNADLNRSSSSVGSSHIHPRGLHPSKVNPKKVKVRVPHKRDDVTKTPDCVTLSLRKERNRTRESTYMSDMGGPSGQSEQSAVKVAAGNEGFASGTSL
jgi:hypothetical protein